MYAITSESQYLADQAHEHWALNFENVGDPHQEISKTCSERDWLALYVNKGDLEFIQRGTTWKVEHPKGYFQPGVLALTESGRVLYRWRSIPSAENLNGTVSRPTARHVWDAVERSLGAGDEAADAEHDDAPEIDRGPPPRMIFFAALIANGWFLRAKSFVYSPGMEPVPTRFAKAFRRWILFGVFWIGALILLPILPVITGLVCWLAWIVRDIRITLHRMENVQEETRAIQ